MSREHWREQDAAGCQQHEGPQQDSEHGCHSANLDVQPACQFVKRGNRHGFASTREVCWPSPLTRVSCLTHRRGSACLDQCPSRFVSWLLMRRVEKAEALELLGVNRRELLGDDTRGCVMCALVTRAAGKPAVPELLAENEHGVALLDRFGSTLGHVLVIARQHVLDTAELPWPVYSELQRLNYEACCALRRAFMPARVFSAILGASAELPMSFPHFHIHAIPIYETDERARPAHVLSWSTGVLAYEASEFSQLSEQIRVAWPARHR